MPGLSMQGLSSGHILIGALILLLLLLHERARFIAAIFVFVVIVIAAADLFGVSLAFWNGS